MNDVLRQKYVHRFRQLDADGDGVITREDVRLRARMLVEALGMPAGTAPARAASAAADAYWDGVTRHAPDGEADGIGCAAFVAALSAAREDGSLREIVRPAVAAHLAVTDRDGDGVVDAAEFVAAQQAMGIPAGQARETFRLLDRDGDGRLALPEWEAAVMEFYTSTDAAAPGNRVLGER